MHSAGSVTVILNFLWLHMSGQHCQAFQVVCPPVDFFQQNTMGIFNLNYTWVLAHLYHRLRRDFVVY